MHATFLSNLPGTKYPGSSLPGTRCCLELRRSKLRQAGRNREALGGAWRGWYPRTARASVAFSMPGGGGASGGGDADEETTPPPLAQPPLQDDNGSSGRKALPSNSLMRRAMQIRTMRNITIPNTSTTLTETPALPKEHAAAAAQQLVPALEDSGGQAQPADAALLQATLLATSSPPKKQAIKEEGAGRPGAAAEVVTAEAVKRTRGRPRKPEAGEVEEAAVLKEMQQQSPQWVKVMPEAQARSKSSGFRKKLTKVDAQENVEEEEVEAPDFDDVMKEVELLKQAVATVIRNAPTPPDPQPAPPTLLSTRLS